MPAVSHGALIWALTTVRVLALDHQCHNPLFQVLLDFWMAGVLLKLTDGDGLMESGSCGRILLLDL